MKKKEDLKSEIDRILKENIEDLVIERFHAKDKSKIYYVLLRHNMKLAIIEKVNPKNKDELIVSYYVNNVLKYDRITSKDILPKSSYDLIKDRNNKINKIFK